MSNIAISYENTITKDFDFWSDFLKYLRLEGHIIHVVGHKWREILLKPLEYNGFILEHHFDEVIPLMEFLKREDRDLLYSEALDMWRCKQSEIWWSSKASACNMYKCSLMLDSDIRYAGYFKNIATRFVNTGDEKVITHLKTILDGIKKENERFEDYDNELSNYME